MGHVMFNCSIIEFLLDLHLIRAIIYWCRQRYCVAYCLRFISIIDDLCPIWIHLESHDGLVDKYYIYCILHTNSYVLLQSASIMIPYEFNCRKYPLLTWISEDSSISSFGINHSSKNRDRYLPWKHWCLAVLIPQIPGSSVNTYWCIRINLYTIMKKKRRVWKIYNC